MTVDDLLLQARMASFLFAEARLLGERRFAEWLELFADPCRYRIPIAEDRDGSPDPLEPSIVDDDLERLSERVYRLTETAAHAQMPPSRTVHSYTNIEVARLDDDRIATTAVFAVSELRVGGPGQVGLGETRMLTGTVDLTIVDASDPRIEDKTIWLIDRDQPLKNLAFLL